MTQYAFGQTIPVTGPNIGFQGTVSRFGERVIAARQFVPYTTTNVLNFGDPAVIIPNSSGGYYDSVLDFVADATANIGLITAQFAGMAVREVKTDLVYPAGSQPGLAQVGYYSNTQMAEVLERGSGTVIITVSNSPAAGSQVYVRLVTNSNVSAGFVGDWEVGTPAATDLFSAATTGSNAAGQKVILYSSTTNMQVGQLISGPGVPVGSYVTAVTANTSVTINNNLTLNSTSGVVYQLSNLFAVPGCVARTGYLDSNNMLEITFERRYAA
jgi:hypothetical protein